MELVEIAFVGELVCCPDSAETFDELSAASTGVSGLPEIRKMAKYRYRSACSSHHCPILVNSALNQPETTFTEIRPFV